MFYEWILNIGTPYYIYKEVIPYKSAVEYSTVMWDRISFIKDLKLAGAKLEPEVDEMFKEYESNYRHLTEALELYKEQH